MSELTIKQTNNQLEGDLRYQFGCFSIHSELSTPFKLFTIVACIC